MREVLDRLLAVDAEATEKVLASLAILVVLALLRVLVCSIAKRKVRDATRFYHFRRIVVYVVTLLALILVGRIWIKGIDSLATFLGLASAGLAIALHDTIANLAGWLFIVVRQPFRVGNRIQIGDVAGDVIDIRLFQFSLIEIGNWVDAEQSTGRIIHVPNSRALREPIANYETGFEYIWHEIPVLITFESDWKRAKALLSTIAHDKTEHLSAGVEQQIRRAAMKYLIYFKHLTPTVYTTVKDCGVQLSVRYIVKPRNRRSSEQEVWEAILDEFGRHGDIQLAYPTTRFFTEPSHQTANTEPTAGPATHPAEADPRRYETGIRS